MFNKTLIQKNIKKIIPKNILINLLQTSNNNNNKKLKATRETKISFI